jgi:hypothetical protein
MSDLNAVRKKLPALAALDDDQLVDALHELYYPQMDKGELANRLGYKPPEKPVEQAGLFRSAGDVGIKLAQGVVDLGQSVVGVGDLATGGAVGNALGKIGYDPKGTNDFLGDYLSDSQKAADAKVQNADGFVDSIAASLQNPRSIIGSIAESAPGMLLGMGGSAALAGRIGVKAALATGEGQAAAAAARAAGKSAAEAAAAAMETGAGKAAAQQAIDAAGTRLLAAGSGIEGAQSAGQIADQAREAGRSYGDYALPSVAAGLGTAAIGLGAGKLMGDAATNIATGSASTAVKGGLAKRIGKEFLSEGVLEEMPQSAQEQVWTNMANGDPLDKGVGNAAGTGLITGGVMGAGLGGFQDHEGAHAAPTPAPVQLPNTGPLSQAANAGQAAQAAKQAAAAAQQAAATPAAPTAPATPAQLPLDAVEARLNELRTIGQGTEPQEITNPDGTTTSVPGVAPRPYTEAEKDEYRALVAEQKKRIAIPADQQAEYNRLLAEEAAQKRAQASAAKGQPTGLADDPLYGSAVDYIGRTPEFAAAPMGDQIQALARHLNVGYNRAARMRETYLMGGKPQTDDMFAPPSAQQQDAEIQRMLAEEAAQRRAAAEREAATTNAIIEHDMLQRAAANRKALRDDVLNDRAVNIGDKKRAFQSAMERQGYTFPVLSSEDHAAIDAHAADTRAALREQILQDQRIPAEHKATALTRVLADHGFKDIAPTESDLDAIAEATAPIPAAPNQLVDAVPERAAPAPTPSGTNTAAVDAAIASGMRLKTANGSVLHKKGSSKIFKLNSAQKAHYLERMAAMEGAQVEAPAAEQQAEPQNIPENIPAEADPQVQAIDAAAHEAATSPMNDRPEPTQAQKEAGNYKKGHIRLHGLEISIENPAGSVRKGVDPDGKPWETTMANHYGDILGTDGADGDPVDVFIGPNPGSEKAFVVDQYDGAGGKFDEHKVMLGFDTLEQARTAYSSNYDADWKGGQHVVETDIAGLKEWLARGKARRPLAQATPANSEVHDFHPRESEIEKGAKEVALTLAQMARREHPATRNAHTDRILVAENYVEGIARENPTRAAAIALELRTNAERYSDLSGMSPDTIRKYAGIISRYLAVHTRTQGTFERLISTTEVRIAEMKRLQAQAGHNAWVYDKKIAEAETALAQYREAAARLAAQQPESAPEQAAQVDEPAKQQESQVDKPAAEKESTSERPMPADYTRNVIHNAQQWGFSGADIVPDEMGRISANFDNNEVFKTKSLIPGTTNSPAAMIMVAQAPNGKWTSGLTYMGPTSGQSVGLGVLPGYESRDEAIRAQLAKLKGNVKPAVYADMEREAGMAPSKLGLNKMTVKDMTDEQLLQAQAIMADTPRAPKIAKEIERRGLDKQAEPEQAATPAPHARFEELRAKLQEHGLTSDEQAEMQRLDPSRPSPEAIAAKAKETGVPEDFIKSRPGIWDNGWKNSDAEIQALYAHEQGAAALRSAYGDFHRANEARVAVEDAVQEDPAFAKYRGFSKEDMAPLWNEVARRMHAEAEHVEAQRDTDGTFENLLAKKRVNDRMEETSHAMSKFAMQEAESDAKLLDQLTDEGFVTPEEKAELRVKMHEAPDQLEFAMVLEEAARKAQERKEATKARQEQPAANDAAPAQVDVVPADEAGNENIATIERAKRRLRETRNQLTQTQGGLDDHWLSPESRAKVGQLRDQENEIVGEIRQLRREAVEKMPQVVPVVDIPVEKKLAAAPAAEEAPAAPAEATSPAPAPEVDHDDGKDIPIAFYKKVKVPHDVWIEDERRYESVEISADKALASVREDIDNLKSLLGCMKG